MGLLGKFFAKFSRQDFSADDIRELEKILIEADLGRELTDHIIADARTLQGEAALVAVKRALRSALLDTSRTINFHENRPTSIMIVGVNGTGKTTSTAKLAHYFSQRNRRVLLAAADTFRAAAVEQISTWAERISIPIVVGQANSDPASVAFEAATQARENQIDLLIIDTAGRLHTKSNLMDELSKIRRVVEKITPIDEVLFVVDGTTGQNGIAQAKVFSEKIPLTGLIVTKLDGSAKGGVALAIERALKVPIKFIGVGELISDLEPFNPDGYVESLTQS